VCARPSETPKVGAECPNWARSDLCGGRPVMDVPTAKIVRKRQRYKVKMRFSTVVVVRKRNGWKIGRSRAGPSRASQGHCCIS
jgi:hypothetical protein